MAGPLKNIIKISSATVGSRALGFARDAATMAFLGLSAVNAAYTFAFTLPQTARGGRAVVGDDTDIRPNP